MADTHQHSYEADERSRQSATQAESQSTSDTGPQEEALLSYSPYLLRDARLGAQNNAPVRADIMQRAQQTHGNRAVQRSLHGSTFARQDIQRAKQDIGPEGGPLPDDLAQRIEALRGAGEPLNGQSRVRMEGAFGEGLDDVRIHVGDEADTLNHRVGAKAFTIGSDIFFREGMDPSDSRLLAHELTHVLQQRGASDGPLSVGPSDDAHEGEAQEASDAIADGGRAQVHTASGPSVARDILDGWGVGDWKILPPTPKGETDGTYDDPESKKRAEMQAADERGFSPTPKEWWKTPKYDPQAPPPWIPKTTIKEKPGEIVVPPKGPDERGDYPLPPWPEDEGYG